MPSARGKFRAISWPADGEYTFLAAIRLPERVTLEDGGAVVLQGARNTDQPILFALPAALAEADFGQHVAERAAANGAAIARFMLDTLRPPPHPSGDKPATAVPQALAELPRLGIMLRAFLSQAAEPDGCIEMMTAVPDGCVLLQGWGARLRGPLQVVLAGGTLPSFAAHAGEFARSDTTAPATGVMLALPPEAAASLHGLDHVFILSDNGLHSRMLVEHRLLDTADSLGHMRHMLTALRAPPPMQALLNAALRPRFEGLDTLTGHEHPVSAAVDLCIVEPEVGAYVSGWLFDPARHVAALHLCGANGESRLDTLWTRVARPDVVEVFADQPRFPRSAGHDAGFTVFTDQVPQDGPFYLQVSFLDGGYAFLPVTPAAADVHALRGRLLDSVDLHKPSGLPIVERHIAPMLSRLRAPAFPAPRIMLAGPVGREHAVVVPLAAPVLPRSFLSGFLHDTLEKTEQLVLVCGPAWDEAGLDALRSRVRFYNLPATIVWTSMPVGALAALREAFRATTAADFVLAGPGISGRHAGWRRALRGALFGHAFACPTLLYEDWSVRYAGAVELRFGDTAPWTERQVRLAGLPVAAAAFGAQVRAEFGTLECCAVTRAAVSGPDPDTTLLTEAGQETAFFMRLRDAGQRGIWAPGVEVYAPEARAASAYGPNPGSSEVARLADGWMVRETWQRRENTPGEAHCAS